MSLDHTYVTTYNEVEFANPYHTCNACGGWITGALDMPGRPLLMPCEHDLGYRDVCSSWSPVDGCSCLSILGHVPHAEPSRSVPVEKEKP